MNLPAMTLVVATLAALTACGAADLGGETADRSGDAVRPTAAVRAEPTTSEAPPVLRSTEEKSMRITMSVGEQSFEATLTDSAASRDLMAQLPLTVRLRDFAGVEKTGPLPSPLSLAGQPKGADPEVGDVGYYAPDNNLVLYYGDQGYYDGIVVLGKLHGDGAARLARLKGSITVTINR